MSLIGFKLLIDYNLFIIGGAKMSRTTKA
jgi:hypothetical protein